MKMNSKIFKKNTILLIGGPTASGKSKLALDIASIIDGEIINSDSMQIYKYFQILTSQPRKKNINNIEHHLYGFLETNQNYSGAKWLKDVNKTINKVIDKKKIPILVGGTGLYFEFLSKGIHYIPKVTKVVKNKVEKEYHEKGLYNLYEKLLNVDPDYAKKVNVNDKHRIIRGIEVFYQTNNLISNYHKREKIKSKFKEQRLLLLPDREEIKSKCEVRFKDMIKEGLVDEIKNHRAKVKNCNIINAIGYSEINNYIEKKISLNIAIDYSIKKTKQYAKRQRTWFTNRFDPHIIIKSSLDKSLLLESLSKIN